MKKKPIAIGMALVIVAILAALMSFTNDVAALVGGVHLL